MKVACFTFKSLIKISTVIISIKISKPDQAVFFIPYVYGPVLTGSGYQTEFFQAGNSGELVRVIEIRLVIGPGCKYCFYKYY